jgi:salicylate hydroxylase
MVHRVDIHEELKRAFLDPTLQGVPEGKLHLGQRVLSCDFENTTLILASGETVHADLIIGADGIKVRLSGNLTFLSPISSHLLLQSTIRREMLGSQFDAPPTGLSTFRWIIPAETINEHPEHSWILSDGPVMIGSEEESFFFCYACRSKTLVNMAGFHQDERDQDSTGLWSDLSSDILISV